MDFYQYTYWLVHHRSINEIRDWVSFAYPTINWWEMYAPYWDNEYDGPRPGMVVWFDETVHTEINVTFKLVQAHNIILTIKPDVFVKLDDNGRFIGPQTAIKIKRHDPSSPI